MTIVELLNPLLYNPKKHGSNPRWNWKALVSNGLTNLGVVQWLTQAQLMGIGLIVLNNS